MSDSDPSSIRPGKIAIIGGGFSGIMTAVNLARLSWKPLHNTIINHRRPTARGVAYGTRRMEHLLNVAARNMSAYPDHLPDHFVNWLRTRSDFDTVPETRAPRALHRTPASIYGDYLRGLIAQHNLQSPGEPAADVASSHHLHRTAMPSTSIRRKDQAASCVLADGTRIGRQPHRTRNRKRTTLGLPGAEESHEIHPAWISSPVASLGASPPALRRHHPRPRYWPDHRRRRHDPPLARLAGRRPHRLAQQAGCLTPIFAASSIPTSRPGPSRPRRPRPEQSWSNSWNTIARDSC